MKRIDEISENIVNLSKSTKDSNRFYSILLDARATAVSENTYDVAERLLRGETDNAKAALEHLWTLKKTMQNSDEVSTIDMLIQYYQKKMDVVRTKEELIKKISRDSRTLLEEKRKRDSELATIKQEISDCSSELQELTIKLERLTIKEQELTLIDTQLRKELLVNENEIINGLYEIILSQQEGQNPVEEFTEKLQHREDAEIPTKDSLDFDNSAINENRDNNTVKPDGEDVVRGIDILRDVDGFDVDKEKTQTYSVDTIKQVEATAGEDQENLTSYKQPEAIQPVPLYPKSVVKTTKGRVIGEYYYDTKAYKNNRHYVFNGRFFLQQISSGLATLSTRPDSPLYPELLQMIQDAYKRITENPLMHFEIATSEVLNEKNIKELWQNMKDRDFAEAGRFCKRLHAKIDALKSNYQAMLKEQMDRYAQ